MPFVNTICTKKSFKLCTSVLNSQYFECAKHVHTEKHAEVERLVKKKKNFSSFKMVTVENNLHVQLPATYEDPNAIFNRLIYIQTGQLETLSNQQQTAFYKELKIALITSVD